MPSGIPTGTGVKVRVQSECAYVWVTGYGFAVSNRMADAARGAAFVTVAKPGRPLRDRDLFFLLRGQAPPPSVGGQPPSAVVPVPFQLGSWWTPKSRALDIFFWS